MSRLGSRGRNAGLHTPTPYNLNGMVPSSPPSLPAPPSPVRLEAAAHHGSGCARSACVDAGASGFKRCSVPMPRAGVGSETLRLGCCLLCKLLQWCVGVSGSLQETCSGCVSIWENVASFVVLNEDTAEAERRKGGHFATPDFNLRGVSIAALREKERHVSRVEPFFANTVFTFSIYQHSSRKVDICTHSRTSHIALLPQAHKNYVNVSLMYAKKGNASKCDRTNDLVVNKKNRVY